MTTPDFVIHLRNGTPALRRGDFATVLTDDIREVYAFQRKEGEQRALVVEVAPSWGRILLAAQVPLW